MGRIQPGHQSCWFEQLQVRLQLGPSFALHPPHFVHWWCCGQMVVWNCFVQRGRPHSCEQDTATLMSNLKRPQLAPLAGAPAAFSRFCLDYPPFAASPLSMRMEDASAAARHASLDMPVAVANSAQGCVEHWEEKWVENCVAGRVGHPRPGARPELPHFKAG